MRGAADADWAAIDAVLGPAFRAFRDECCALLGFAPDAWPHIPMLAQLSRDLAVVQLGQRLQREKGLHSWDAALDEAQYELRVSADLRRQLRRWRAAAAADNSSLPDDELAP